MTLQEIKTKIENSIKDAKVEVTGDGCNCSTIVIAPIFTNIPLLKRQRMILAIFKNDINSGKLHALSIQAKAPNE